MEQHDNYIVEMKNITKLFPGIVALDDVSISIKKGEIFALLGENGAGKSTLMSILFGMYEADKGAIFVNGTRQRITSPNIAARLNIGMVHQHFKLVSNFTVTENIVLGAEPTKKILGIFSQVDIKGTNEKIHELSVQYGLEVDPTKRIDSLPVSTQQRVEILKMLYRKAEILIFDEPTAMLTPQEITFLLQIIRNLRDNGKTIILITHKLDEIKQVADRCAILNHGKLINILPVAITTTQEMARQMVGREVSFQTPKKPPSYGKEILQIKNLTVYNQDKFPVVKNVSFSVREGEVFAIAGVSGNGQVEIADAITGLQEVASGSVMLDGKNITKTGIRQRSLAGISYVPEDRQEVGLFLDFTLESNLGLKRYFQEPFSKKGFLKRPAFREYAQKLITQFDIRSGQGPVTIVRSMSGGNQQKGIIAREISQDSKLLIFVQPTRGLDIGAISAIHQRIIEQRDAGKAVLLVSLELDEVMNCADTIGVMYSGEMLKIADAASITTDELGEYMMGVKKG